MKQNPVMDYQKVDRLLITGNRDWADEESIRRVLTVVSPKVLIEGEARGVDAMSRDIARQMGIEVMPFPARWGDYGRAAGPIRNTQMLKEGKPDLVVYFHDDLAKSRGTANMVKQARAASLPVIFYREV